MSETLAIAANPGISCNPTLPATRLRRALVSQRSHDYADIDWYPCLE